MTVQSAPYFDIDKLSADIDGDPTLLLAGERLRYTITVRNIGTSDTTDAVLRDAIPVNTAYVAGSTTLNGAPVADAPGGASPLTNGIALSTPSTPTPGVIPADRTPDAQTAATLVFIVRVNDDVIDGTVISNQAFVSAPASAVLDRPSDDPRTAVVDDPTRDLVGDLPFLFAVKTAALQVDSTVARHRRSRRRAALHDSDLQQRPFARDRGPAARLRAAEHHLRRRYVDVELPAGR